MVTTLYNPVIAEEAKKKGKIEGINEVALKMLKENVDITLIEKYTGLTNKEILKLKEKMRL